MGGGRDCGWKKGGGEVVNRGGGVVGCGRMFKGELNGRSWRCEILIPKNNLP